jgi:chromosome segregation ATPase
MSAEWRLQQALSAVHAGIRSIREEDADATISLDESDETVQAVETALRQLITKCQETEDLAELAKNRARELTERAARLDARGKRYRGVMLAAMDAMGWTKREFAEATVSIRNPSMSVMILDASELPQGFTVQKPPEPDKKAIAIALKSGQDVPGATLTPGMPSVVLKGN